MPCALSRCLGSAQPLVEKEWWVHRDRTSPPGCACGHSMDPPTGRSVAMACSGSDKAAHAALSAAAPRGLKPAARYMRAKSAPASERNNVCAGEQGTEKQQDSDDHENQRLIGRYRFHDSCPFQNNSRHDLASPADSRRNVCTTHASKCGLPNHAGRGVMDDSLVIRATNCRGTAFPLSAWRFSSRFPTQFGDP